MLKRNWNRKIAIKTLAILQTGDLPAILRYRPIFDPHRILPLSLSMRGIKGEGSSQKLSAASSDRQLASFPQNQCLFWRDCRFDLWIFLPIICLQAYNLCPLWYG